MQKINKTTGLLSTKYKDWLDNLNKENKVPDGTNRYYYHDIIFNLYKIQSGVCAYTEMRICIPELYTDNNWVKGRHCISTIADYSKKDHFDELDHFDPNDKKLNYWNWNNLFMVHASINGWKTYTPVVPYLKPDLETYSPEKYLDYDEKEHLFRPNTDITDPTIIDQIQYMIDKVLFLNHGVVKIERANYINEIKFKKDHSIAFTIDRFFTALKWVLGE